MCDFGCFPSVSSNVIPIGNSTLPDMDELLDMLENEPLQLLSFNSNSTAQEVHSPEQQQKQKQNVPLNGQNDEKMTKCDNEEKSDIGRHLGRKVENICDETEGQIVSEQQHQQVQMPFPQQRFVHDKRNEQTANQIHSREKCVKAFMKGTETNEASDDDLFEQIDRMAAQIKAEELGCGVEEVHDDNSDKCAIGNDPSELVQFCTSGECIDNFVEEMVASILKRVLAEATDGIQKKKSTKEEEKRAVVEESGQMNGRKDEKDGEENDQSGEKAQMQTEVPNVPHNPSSPSSSSQQIASQTKIDSLAIVHDLSVALDEFKLTESELQLGKKKPYWIPDEECLDCMLCATRFSIVNRRHHCRACGRVLCRICCSKRRLLAYMEEKEGKQRVCVPCNRTLDRIEEYEQRRMVDSSGHGNNAIGNELEQNRAVSDATRQPAEQKNDQSDKTLRQSAADVLPANSALTRPKKKSLLKQSSSTVGPSVVVSDHQTEAAAPIGPDNTQSLEQTRQMSSSVTVPNKRSVTFRDGVNPGHDGSTPNSQSVGQSSTSGTIKSVSAQSTGDPSLYQWLISGGGDQQTSTIGRSFGRKPFIPKTANGTDSSANENKKQLPRKMSKRSRERRMEEEAQSLLILKGDGDPKQSECRIWLMERRDDGGEEMVRGEVAEIERALGNSEEEEGTGWTVALRRNFHLRIERRKICAEDRLPILSVSTRGLASLGVDELFLAFQYDPAIFAEDKLDSNSELLALLQQFDLIFRQFLDSEDVTSVDHKMGIRKCVFRMNRLYPFFRKGHSFFGHKFASILFHRPHHKQNFANFRLPFQPFLIGVFVQMEELPWAKCVPCRLLLRLGMFSGEYPFPVVNVHRAKPLFTTNAVQLSVLKVFNDFRFWSYRMSCLSGCIVAIRGTTTEVILSSWALDDLRQIVASNRNMIGWSLDQLCAYADAEEDDTVAKIDSHLVCVQEEADDGVTPSFVTRVFSNNDQNTETNTIMTNKAIGVSFLIFDGALRGNEQLSVSLVEDGLVVRLNADLMEQLGKALTTGDSFTVLNDHGHRLSIAFRDPKDENSIINDNSLTAEAWRLSPGALHSPIDGKPLEAHVQYGLDRSRLLRSLQFFQFSSEWALRLSAVINMLPGKFPSAFQPRFFDLCEQLAKHIVPTLEPFLQELIIADQRSISLRVHVDGETIKYETEKWQALPEQHFVWTVTLDEQLIPFLYGLCAWLPSVFFVELHSFIVSTRPLPALTIPDEL